MQLLLMADGRAGLEITRWLLEYYPGDLGLIVTTGKNELFERAAAAAAPVVMFESPSQLQAEVARRGLTPDIGVLAWWPHIIRPPLLGLPAHGFVNTHPSLLPYNRGKHYNFWALVEQAPFGVSLHFIDQGVDSGDVIAQRPIPYGWEDTGATLYAKAWTAMVELFAETYPTLRTLQAARCPQDLSQGSFHHSCELAAASVIDLDRTYRARDLLNLIRARTFPGYPACSFTDAGEEYEVRVAITRKATT